MLVSDYLQQMNGFNLDSKHPFQVLPAQKYIMSKMTNDDTEATTAAVSNIKIDNKRNEKISIQTIKRHTDTPNQSPRQDYKIQATQNCHQHVINYKTN